MYFIKRLSQLVLLTGLGLAPLFGQTRTISGIVTSSLDEQAPLSGATVQVKGTSTGTITDVNGNYTINVQLDATTLVFSFAGMTKAEAEINDRIIIDVVMEPEIVGLEEVVITTGYDIKRSSRSSTSLTQVLDGEQVNTVRQTNINSALAGKVSGIQFRGQPGIILNRTGSIRLRGDGGFGTGNSIQYVVDGTVLPNSADILLDDIEDISVASGPSASAILGSQGANGAIIITTKKDRSGDNRDWGVEVNLGVKTSSVYLLPECQNEYAGGSLSDSLTKYLWSDTHPIEWQSLDGKYYQDYRTTESWGPKMEGQEYIPWYSWYPGSKYTGTTTRLHPQPDNVRDFYERGWTFNNNIAFTKDDEKYNIRAIIGRYTVNGNLPGSSLDRSNFTLKGSYNLGKRLTFSANVNYFTTLINGEYNDWINNQSSGFLNTFFHRNIDMNIMEELRNLKTPDGIFATWNHGNPDAYDPDNPRNFYAAVESYNNYTFFDNIELPSRSDRIFGNFSLAYQIINDLSIKITYRRYQTNGWREEKYNTDLYNSQLGIAEWWSNPKVKGYYSTFTAYASRENFESLLSFNKRIGDITIKADAGSDFFRAISKSNGANTVNGLVVPNLFAVENSVDQPHISNIRTNEKYRALFLRGDVGFRNYLFGEFTLRNDWYSSLPPSNNAVFSKSFGLAWVFSNQLNLSFMDVGKVRISWGEIPTAIPIYIYPGSEYNYSLYKWNDNLMTTTPDFLVDSTIHGAVKTQWELGMDARFLGNRLGFSATYWNGAEKDIPYPVTIAGYSGYTTRYMNTGEISKQGLDLLLSARVVSKQNLTYDIDAIFSYLIKNEVVKISDNETGFVAQSVADLGPAWGLAPTLTHEEGQPWGILKGQGMKMWEGKPVLNENGTYADTIKSFGSVLPKITGGFQNTFRILGKITITANLDYQVGGKYFSLSDWAGSWAGVVAKTAGKNDLGNPIRDPVDKNDPSIIYISGDEATQETGGVHISGVNENHEEVEYYVDAYTYFTGYTSWADIYDPNVFDLSYLKLRELSIGYDFQLEKNPAFSKYIRDIRISLFALNLWLIYAKNRDFDPSEISRAGGEWSQFPGTRSFGINMKVNF